MGFSLIDDANMPDSLCDGISNLDSTVDQNKQRVSTLEAFLPRSIALKRESNLTICTRVIVSRNAFSRVEAQHRAEKFCFQYADPKLEKTFSVKVKKEFILSSGALGSPHVLMLRSVDCFPILSRLCLWMSITFFFQWYWAPPASGRAQDRSSARLTRCRIRNSTPISSIEFHVILKTRS